MANYYSQTVFTIPATPQERAVLEECFAVSAVLSTDVAELPDVGIETVKAYYASCSDAFRATFPKRPDEEDPFADFFDLWSDPDFPEFNADLTIRDDPDGKGKVAFISGHEADVSALASLIQKVCKTALPFAFQWAEVADKDVPGGFGGGYYVITDSEIFGGSTRWLMEETLETLRAGT
ncbi:hypothetical protein DFR49_0720 [Hephaestia caeni]|uniref:Uncharacterized protein n=1 Tax=Hephaestia caeni TaxID=645617 RepID=A0A397PG95_9SPHN|nr:hypothetical protein [Hephaestia caeni]RIA46187.1 hypothetical protein DFR49_0720 [Hephaestia caeni]